jgi:hypothetical protein
MTMMKPKLPPWSTMTMAMLTMTMLNRGHCLIILIIHHFYLSILTLSLYDLILSIMGIINSITMIAIVHYLLNHGHDQLK